MSYNKFVKSNVSKLGQDIVRSGGLTPIMQTGVMNAIPIWELLNITEEQYLLDYEYSRYVENEKAITELMKKSYDVSLGILKDETKDILYDKSFAFVEAQDEPK